MDTQCDVLHISPSFKASDASKCKPVKIEREDYEVCVGHAERLELDARNLSFKQGDIRKPKSKRNSFFSVKIKKNGRSNKYILVIPYRVRDRVHALGTSMIQIKSVEGKIYNVGLRNGIYISTFANGDWTKFITDHGLCVGDELFFCFQENEPHLVLGFKAKRDRYKTSKGYTMVESVRPSFSRAPFNQNHGQVEVAVVQKARQLAPENVVPSLEEEHAATTGVEVTHVLDSFKLRLTPSDIRTMLTIPKARADKLKVTKRGEVGLIMTSPPVIVSARYNIWNSGPRVDGRLAVTGGWKEFVRQSGLQQGKIVKIDVCRVNDKLMFYFAL